MYQALYRKWRPKTFDDLVGQDAVSITLKNQVAGGKPSHAYLFCGSRGTGKTSSAKILSKAVNCLSPDGGNPCCVCDICMGADNESLMDITEIDAASNSGVDNIRALREELVYSPVASNRRVYIIDEVHMLSAGAFNALLKTLEEPPPHVLFILATTETHKVPATIVSRCQRFAFRRIAKDVIYERMRHICETEKISIDPAALDLLAQMADGSLRDALSLLDQCSGEGSLTEGLVRETLGLAGLSGLALWLREAGDLQKSIGHLDALYQAGMDAAAILGQLSALLRDLLMGQMLGDLSVTRLPPGEAETLSAQWPRERILWALDRFAETRLSRSGDKKLEAELCLIRLACLETAEEPEMAKAPPPPKPEASSIPHKPSAPPPESEPPSKSEPPPEPASSAAMTDAERDPRWPALLNSVNNPLLRDALSKSGAKVDGDRLVIQTDDPFIQGVIKQAEKRIMELFPGTGKPAGGNHVLDALIASAGDLVIEE